MKPRHARWPIQVFRIATLVLPPAMAWDVAFSAHRTKLMTAVTYLLGALWALMAGALAARSLDALWRGRDGCEDDPSLLDMLDVLTASGSSLVWTASAAIAAAVWIGWASLSAVGLLGLSFVEVVVLWTLVVAGGTDPWRRASLSRRFPAGTVTENDPLIEEVRLSNPRIPTGFRLFAAGRIGPRWPMSRYVVGEGASGGEVVLESDVGPAVRGEHLAEPLSVWLQDVFGLCHSVRRRAGAATISVLPRVRPVDGTEEVLGRGGYDKAPRPALAPTEGSLRLREYQPGDDARRIHWVRSLAARQVVVRLPDELPPDRPKVRVVLDTFLAGADQLSCDATGELLDALVGVWLGAAKSIADRGARVTLVTAVQRGGKVVTGLQRLVPQTLQAALCLGAEVRWQETTKVDDLVADGTTVVVSFRLQPDPAGRVGEPGRGSPNPSGRGGEPSGRTVRWIVVPVSTWAVSDEPLQRAQMSMLPHLMGSPENRWSRRRRDRLRRERARHDRGLLLDVCMPTRSRAELAGTFSARPAARERIRLEAL